MRGFGVVLLALVLPAVALPCLPAGCAPSEEPAAEAPGGDIPRGTKEEMRRLLQAAADAADFADAQPAAEVTWYTPETLYDYIDGQAEEFRDAGFVALAHAEYRAEGAAGDAYVEVDLYRMTSAEAAEAVMQPPPPDDTLALAPGVQAYRAETLCEFAAGAYYVRITPRFDAEGQADLVDALARALATGIQAD